jgi:outer membrane lipoprotein-sorting protein
MAAAAMAATLAATSRAADDGALALVRQVRQAAPSTPFTAHVELSSDAGWTRELTLNRKTVGQVDASYMEVTAPADLKDTRFLYLDHRDGPDEQAMYVPAAKRVIRISPQTRTQAFLGSEFAIGDLVQPQVDDATYRFVGETEVGGRHAKLVESVPKNPADAMYSKTIVALDPTDLLVLQTEFFDGKGRSLKVWTIEKLQKIDGVWTPLEQSMQNKQQPHWTKLKLRDVKYNAPLSDEMFERTYLSR